MNNNFCELAESNQIFSCSILFSVADCLTVWAIGHQWRELQGCRTLQSWSDQLPLFDFTDCSDVLPFICRSSKGKALIVKSGLMCWPYVNTTAEISTPSNYLIKHIRATGKIQVCYVFHTSFTQLVTWRWSRWLNLRAHSLLPSWTTWWSSQTKPRSTSFFYFKHYISKYHMSEK